jgi:hypothetical protein
VNDAERGVVLLRDVLVGEHCARTFDVLMLLTSADESGAPVLDVPVGDARALVAWLDAYFDVMESIGGQRAPGDRTDASSFAPRATS